MSFLPSRMASGHDDRVAGTSVGAAPAAGEESVGTGKVLNEFCCDICGLTAPFEVFSTSPPTRGVTRKIRYREKCYSSMDTFRPPSDRLPMVVGAPCSGKVAVIAKKSSLVEKFENVFPRTVCDKK
jgi:hypothetical protein